MVAGQILAAKRMGFSFEELATLTVGEVLELADLYWPDEEGDEKGRAAPRARMATQADIDRLMS